MTSSESLPAWFLGPHAENAELLEKLIAEALRDLDGLMAKSALAASASLFDLPLSSGYCQPYIEVLIGLIEGDLP